LGKLENRVAVITGGSRGIGFAIALRLLQDGASVAICSRSESSLSTACETLAAHGFGAGRVFSAPADVSNHSDVSSFFAAVMKRFARVDALINNAGVGIFMPVAEMSPEEWNRMIGLNLSGVYYCCREVLPIFKQQASGDIINISSLAGKNPFAGGAGYNASKFGLNGFSEAMMLDHRNDGVRVSYVMPGSVATGFGRDATEFGGGPASSGADWKIAPEDIAEVVAALLAMPARTTVSRVEIRPSRPKTR
jgi:NAD(P)-dependent dehydrogenase (short-subunit alcohol dehydrogenase family)